MIRTSAIKTASAFFLSVMVAPSILFFSRFHLLYHKASSFFNIASSEIPSFFFLYWVADVALGAMGFCRLTKGLCAR
ncbi:MAG: hypothetical protein IKN72_07515 [Clostridia bacterium]|nr:hypothetical protein [Clostridia bacterium]